MNPRRLFVAGATGATGRVLVPMAQARGLAVVPHVRPASAATAQLGTATPAVFELADAPRLTEALRGCTTVVQLIGTMRKRFSRGDTYETSDIGTTRQLVDAAKAAGIDHVVLLSSVGAGGPGAYLQAKAKAEQLVKDSGLAWTIFRPSMLEGEDRRPPPGARALTRLFGLKKYAPIRLEELSAAMLTVSAGRSHLGELIEGAALFELAA